MTENGNKPTIYIVFGRAGEGWVERASLQARNGDHAIRLQAERDAQDGGEHFAGEYLAVPERNATRKTVTAHVQTRLTLA